ncbi:MAG: hypothetical protein A2149_09705 [Candidatus Schekmanbacteria bacterium RBG_16_38_11]|uniref:CopG family transcriptional regulator n=1 Tax=Candidatus Schekmanbacteria bacterium RBG_16_38_11 TaxID=1817880 RepID=A0A1F7RVM8_9BACT|nr:MAG: hypothetical protein A2149_09705 [Candidatus Schekmanbacteria bacterium RBG_16_38_11]
MPSQADRELVKFLGINLTVDVPKKLDEEVKLGIFPDISAAINAALKKAYAKKSRAYLKWLMKKECITEAAMMKEIETLRK